MKRKTKESAKEITKTILELLGIGALITTAGILGGGVRADKLVSAYLRFGNHRIRQTIKRLRIQQLIQYDPEDEHSPIRLTRNGFIRIKRQKLREAFRVPKRWDHLWRIVIFDIPEKKRVRKYVQRELIQTGFCQLQKSVYVRPHDCSREIDLLKQEFRVWEHLLLLTAPTLGPWEQKLRTHFFNRQ